MPSAQTTWRSLAHGSPTLLRHLAVCRLWCAPMWALAALAALALASTTALGAEGVTPRALRLGMVNDQSGPAAGLGRGMRLGAQAVFAELNSRGGVHGRHIDLELADDGYDAEQTAMHTLQLLQGDGVLALLGFVGTANAKAVVPMLGEMNVPLVGVVSGAASLRQPVTPQVFHLRASYAEEVAALVTHLRGQGLRRFGVVYQNDSFGLEVLAAVREELAQSGLTLYASAPFQRNTVAIRSALAHMTDQEPEVVITAGPTAPVAAFIERARTNQVPWRMATLSFADSGMLVSKLRGQADGVLISQVMPFQLDDGSTVTRECRALLQRHAQVALDHANLEGCITARLVVEALQRAGPAPNRARLMAALDNAVALDMGDFALQFSSSNHEGSHRVFLAEVAQGRLTRLAPPAVTAVGAR